MCVHHAAPRVIYQKRLNRILYVFRVMLVAFLCLHCGAALHVHCTRIVKADMARPRCDEHDRERTKTHMLQERMERYSEGTIYDEAEHKCVQASLKRVSQFM